MRLVSGDAPLARQLAVTTAVLLPLAAWWLRAFPRVPADLFGPCVLRATTGAPCPTCGGTRALLALAHLQPGVALAANPLVTLGVAALAVWAMAGVVATLVPRWRRRIEASPGEGRRLVVVVGMIVIASWTWLVVS